VPTPTVARFADTAMPGPELEPPVAAPAAVIERLPRIAAGIERVEAVTGPRQVAAALEELQAQLRAVAVGMPWS